MGFENWKLIGYIDKKTEGNSKIVKMDSKKLMSRGSKKDKTLLKATDDRKLWRVMINKVWKGNSR